MTEIDLDALEALAKTHLVQCGPCDFGLVEYGCNCPKGDPRSVISQLVEVIAEVRQLREQLDEAQAENRALNDAVEPFGDCAPDCDCGDHQGVCLCHVTGAEAREWIRREEARADQAEQERDQLRAANIELAISNDALAFQANAAASPLTVAAGRADLDAFERLIGSLTAELRLLREQRDRVLARTHVVDADDVTEWQRGYRSCSEVVRTVYAGSSQGEGGEPK